MQDDRYKLPHIIKVQKHHYDIIWISWGVQLVISKTYEGYTCMGEYSLTEGKKTSSPSQKLIS